MPQRSREPPPDLSFPVTLRRSFPPVRRFVAYSSISAALGVVVLLVMGVGRTWMYTTENFAVGAILGLCLNLGATAAEGTVFSLLRVPGRWRLWPRVALATVCHFFGGMGGYLVSLAIAQRLELGTMGLDPAALPSVPVFGLVAVLVGGTYFVVRVLRQRLLRSVERLKEQEYAERELEVARALQQRLLPPASLSGLTYRIEARNLPAHTVACDFYDVFVLPGGELGIVLGDVAGQGIAAALVMSSAKAMVPLLAAERTVEETLYELNQRLRSQLGPREFVALAFLRFSPETGEVVIGNAGLPDPYLLSSELRTLTMPGPRLPLGARDSVRYSTQQLVLRPGEALMLFSDGIPEAPDRDDLLLGYEGLEDLVKRLHLEESDGHWVDLLLGALKQRSSEHQADDWTVLILEHLAGFA